MAGKARKIWEPFPGSQERFLSCPVWEVLLHGNRGGGKSQPLWSSVLTPEGFKLMSDLSIGSEILCPVTKEPKKISNIFPQGKIDVYRIKTEHGIAYSSLDHLWVVKIENEQQESNNYLKTTKDLIYLLDNGINVFIPRFDEITPLSKVLSIHKFLEDFCQCIKVDSIDGLYVTNDFIVTHNTDVLLMDFLQGVGVGYGIDYRGLLLREATTELGDVISKSKKWIPRIFPTAKFNNQKKIWTFEGGETLWLNYARVEDDYEQYHGHSKCVKSLVKLPNNKFKQAGDIKVGDLIQTLQGVKKITKVYKYKKSGVKVSVYDICSNLIGEQYQGVLHPVLTNAGWQRVGLGLLSCTSLQSSILEPLIAEVQEFLTEIHQEISQASLRLSLHPLDSATSKHLPVLYSYLNQISGQFSDMKRPVFSIPEFLFYGSQEILWELFLQTYEKTFGILFHTGFQNVQQFLFYCDFLQILVFHVREVHVGLLHSMLCHIGYKVSSHKQLVDCFLLRKNIQRQSNPLQPLLVSLIVQVCIDEESAWHDTLKYVQIVRNKGQGYQDHYCSDFYPNDEQPLRLLGIVESFFPLQNDAQECNHEESILDDQVNKRMVFRDKFCGDVLHPYYHTPFQTDTSLTELSFSISSLDSPIDMVDFEVQDMNHYITSLNINDNKQNNVNNQEKLQVQLIDQNSYCWIGWEELTNHPLPNVYLKMMSCNRTAVPNIPLKYRATCNPSGPGHTWVKERFIDKVPPEKLYFDEFKQSRTHIQSNLLENKALLDADPSYQDKLLAMTQDNKMLRDAWVYGSWDLISGGFFTDVWDKKIHVLESFRIPRSWTLLRSFDWGSSKPWCVTYGVEANGEQPEPIKGQKIPFIPRGSVIIINEIYGWNGSANEGDRATSQEIAERVLQVDYSLNLEYKLRVTPGPADTAIWEVRDGTSIAANLNTHGCRWTKAYKGSGSRIAGWAMIRQMLGAVKRGDLETPHLYFFEQAQHHIRTLPVMQRDKKKPEDIDSELEDHCLDSLRYLLTRKMLRFKRKKVGY